MSEDYKINTSTELFIGIDQKLKPHKATIYGFQHLLAMFGGTIAAPLIVANALGLSDHETALLLQVMFIAMGIATILQTTIGTRLPIVQGSSFALVPPSIAIGKQLGMAGVEGAIILGGIVEALAGGLGLIGKIKKVFSPIVTSVALLLIGFGLASAGVSDFFGITTGNYASTSLIVKYILIGAITLGTTIYISVKVKGFLRTIPVLVGGAVGYVVATLLGVTNTALLREMPLVGVPKVLPWGSPVFSMSALITILFGYLISMIESVGDYHATGAATGIEITEKHLNRGIAAEGLGCTIAGIFGSIGATSFSQNIGLIALTKIGSRQVVQYTGIFLILLAFIPKFSALIATMPSPVVGGISISLFGLISMMGLKIIKENVELNDRNMLILATALVFGLGTPLLPQDYFSYLPPIIASILESGMATGCLVAITLDQLLPKSER